MTTVAGALALTLVCAGLAYLAGRKVVWRWAAWITVGLAVLAAFAWRGALGLDTGTSFAGVAIVLALIVGFQMLARHARGPE